MTIKSKLAFLLLLVFGSANANETSLNENATKWRLQDYVPNGVTIFFSSSSTSGCLSGRLLMPATASSEDRARLWATVLAAKTANRNVFVYYEATTCTINSFGMDG